MRVRLPLILGLLGATLALSGCGGGGGGEPASNEIGPIHVHGLGVNPADDALFVATHTGLYRLAEDSSELERVGDDFQDTMGFTVVGPDRFLGSGHPDARMDLPPYLGLIESTDAGEEWRPVSLLGEADFHVLEAAGDHVYGFGSDFESRREQFLVSDDGGLRWRSRQAPESLLSLAINPGDPNQIVASGGRTLFRSDDAGGSWQPLAGEPGLLTWPTPDSLYLVDKAGNVATSEGTESRWNVVGALGGRPAAFEADDGGTLYAALHDGTITESDDGGQTWEELSGPDAG